MKLICYTFQPRTNYFAGFTRTKRQKQSDATKDGDSEKGNIWDEFIDFLVVLYELADLFP